MTSDVMVTDGRSSTLVAMNSTSVGSGPKIGQIIRSRRQSLGRSQLQLSLDASVSNRHLSYVETGRSNPSREMVLTLASALEVPLRERNAWLEAAGYAAVYRETPLEAPSMSEIRAALGHILAAHGPNPAFVFDRRYDIVMRNEAASRLLSFFAPRWEGSSNLIEMLVSPRGLQPAVEHWAERAAHGIDRVRRELSGSRTTESEDALLRRLVEAERRLPPLRASVATPAEAAIVPVKMRRGAVAVEFFSMITTLGTPLDVTLQELRIETFFPTTPESREAFRSILAS
jgi:transcriptional regulator with XRE-family HTH domain